MVFSLSIVSTASGDLTKRINRIIQRPSQKKVQFSIGIVKADSGKMVYNRNLRKALVPASNMKIITSAAALKYLGADYVYKTKIGLQGNSLVVIGSGDPLLGDKVTDAKMEREDGWIYEDIAAALKQKGIKTDSKPKKPRSQSC